MIEVKNVVKTFDGFRALDDLTMTVPHGAVYGLVGPNGAGKSTIIRHLAGIYRQDSGSATTGTTSRSRASGRWRNSSPVSTPISAGSGTRS